MTKRGCLDILRILDCMFNVQFHFNGPKKVQHSFPNFFEQPQTFPYEQHSINPRNLVEFSIQLTWKSVEATCDARCGRKAHESFTSSFLKKLKTAS